MEGEEEEEVETRPEAVRRRKGTDRRGRLRSDALPTTRDQLRWRGRGDLKDIGGCKTADERCPVK
eukprot:270402-Hanusia_phi.AAC.1